MKKNSSEITNENTIFWLSRERGRNPEKFILQTNRK